MIERTLCYCYHCRTHHGREEVRRVLVRTSYRWRCKESIRGSQRPAAERDAFGRAQTDEHRAASANWVEQQKDKWEAVRPADVAGLPSEPSDLPCR